VGIDLSPEMIDQAVRLADGIGNVRFEVADAEHLPFDDRAFTAVLCSNSFPRSSSRLPRSVGTSP
jgi:ubiquinone/menaquinone biosynthesis C-methylase UbiE